MITVVVDANFSLAQVLPLPYSQDVYRVMGAWQHEIPRVLVPGLWEYEVTNGLRRAAFQRLLSLEEAHQTLDMLLGMKIGVAPSSSEQLQLALQWADRMRQSRAYDAQYLGLTELVGAELWTEDRRLANAAVRLGATWVHWVGEEQG